MTTGFAVAGLLAVGGALIVAIALPRRADHAEADHTGADHTGADHIEPDHTEADELALTAATTARA